MENLLIGIEKDRPEYLLNYAIGWFRARVEWNLEETYITAEVLSLLNVIKGKSESEGDFK